MNIEISLVLTGLSLFGWSTRQRWAGGASREENQHLNVFVNLGCVFVIIGFGALIIETLSDLH